MQGDDDYERLPAAIKASYSRKAWLWLSDQEKALLARNECEPEGYDD
jgi:hypothetical protein